MKYLKKFEDIEEDESEQETIETIRNDVAEYLENVLKEKNIEAFEECTYSDYEYDNKKIIYYEFTFISLDMGEDDDDKFDKFTKDYNLGEYNSKFIKYNSRGYYIFTIALKDSRIEELHNDSEIYYSSKTYNL